MPLREFTDADRRTWQVWDTVPKSPIEDSYFAQNARMIRNAAAEEYTAPVHLPRRFTEGREHGWLTFMCSDEKRRLSPIPERWEALSDEELARLLARAERVARITGIKL
ncbi:MAG: hypothetical protein ACJ79S_20810 [Gemmatimonadaceae bacterium]